MGLLQFLRATACNVLLMLAIVKVSICLSDVRRTLQPFLRALEVTLNDIRYMSSHFTCFTK